VDIMVREAKMSDVEGITTILRELQWFETIDSESFEESKNRVNERLLLCQADDSHSVFVAEGDDSRVMGYASVHWLPYFYLPGLEGYISELFIMESDRGHGVGTLILESIKLEANERGCSRLRLINMRKKESYHREFYKKLGWEERTGDFSFELLL
jgi:GNAT superfamily N-acetyltransferase